MSTLNINRNNLPIAINQIEEEFGIMTFLGNDFLSDCEFVYKNSKIKFHKLIFEACSKYLEKFFIKDSNKNQINLPDLISTEDGTSNPDIQMEALMKIVFKFAYSNQNFQYISNLVTEKNIYKLLSLSSILEIKKLNDELGKFVTSKGLLNSNNCARTMMESLILENEGLIEECLKLISCNFDKVLNDPNEKTALLELPYPIFYRIVSNNNLLVESEKPVYEIIIEYILSRRSCSDIVEEEKNNELIDIQGGGEYNLKAIVVNENIAVNKLEKKESISKSINADLENALKIPQDEEDEKNLKENQEVILDENLDVKQEEVQEDKLKVEEKPIIDKQSDKENEVVEDNSEFERIHKIKEYLKKVKLTNDQEKELILCIRFGFLSHNDLLQYSTNEILKDSKDLILEGISIRLNPYESVDNKNRYKINLNPRLYKNNKLLPDKTFPGSGLQNSLKIAQVPILGTSQNSFGGPKHTGMTMNNQMSQMSQMNQMNQMNQMGQVGLNPYMNPMVNNNNILLSGELGQNYSNFPLNN